MAMHLWRSSNYVQTRRDLEWRLWRLNTKRTGNAQLIIRRLRAGNKQHHKNEGTRPMAQGATSNLVIGRIVIIINVIIVIVVVSTSGQTSEYLTLP